MPDAPVPLKPHPAFRPDPTRGLFIQGLIDQQLVDRVTPRIIELQAKSREPITVYIDSKGGSTASVETLLRLLRSSNQDYAAPCHIITVVTSRSASAAADLLSSGDYAIAYDEAAIMYHGVRTSPNDPITVESASFLSSILKAGNDRYAMALANRCNSRFIFRYVNLRPKFSEYRERESKPNYSDLQCFFGLTTECLTSKGAKRVFKRAIERNARYQALLRRVVAKAGKRKRFKNPRRFADREAAILKEIIDFEVASNKKSDWTFQEDGLAQLNDDFLLLLEFVISSESDQLKEACKRWETFFLSEEEQEELQQLPEDQINERRIEKLKPLLRPVWLFFVALCHALQEGEENEGNYIP